MGEIPKVSRVTKRRRLLEFSPCYLKLQPRLSQSTAVLGNIPAMLHKNAQLIGIGGLCGRRNPW